MLHLDPSCIVAFTHAAVGAIRRPFNKRLAAVEASARNGCSRGNEDLRQLSEDAADRLTSAGWKTWSMSTTIPRKHSAAHPSGDSTTTVGTVLMSSASAWPAGVVYRVGYFFTGMLVIAAAAAAAAASLPSSS